MRYYGKIHSKLPIFHVKSVKIYTSQKSLHWRRQPRQWQLSGMNHCKISPTQKRRSEHEIEMLILSKNWKFEKVKCFDLHQNEAKPEYETFRDRFFLWGIDFSLKKHYQWPWHFNLFRKLSFKVVKSVKVASIDYKWIDLLEC